MEVVEKTESRKIKYNSDKVIPIVVLFLTGISILMVYSMRGNVVLQHLRHILFAFVGMTTFYIINYKLIGRFSPILLLGAFGLAIWTLQSEVVRGVSVLGHDVQTFYIIGFLIIIYLSNSLGRRIIRAQQDLSPSEKNNFKYQLDSKSAWRLFAILGIICLMIAVLNMSTAIILGITGMVILIIGGIRGKDAGIMIASVLVAIIAVVIIVSQLSDDKKNKIGRMATFINRWEYFITNDNSNGYGDQMILARTAIARSGLHPAGPGNGVIKNRLPEKETDYAFASMFEETGIVVGMLVLFAYLIIFYRSWKIARNADGPYGCLLAFGIGFWFTIQALIHIGVNCELLPATGQTLPFISSGGSSFFVSGCAMGILLNIEKISRREKLNKKEFINIGANNQ